MQTELNFLDSADRERHFRGQHNVSVSPSTYQYTFKSETTHLTGPKNKKQVTYKESDSEGEDDEDVIFRPSRKNSVRGRAAKRRKTSPESEDEFQDAGDGGGDSDDGKLPTIPS